MSKILGSALHTVIKDLDDEDVQHIIGGTKEKPEYEALTVRKAIRLGLTSSLDEDKGNGDEKFKNFELARKIYGVPEEGELLLKVEDVTKIKTRVGKVWGAEIVGFIYPLVDEAEKE